MYNIKISIYNYNTSELDGLYPAALKKHENIPNIKLYNLNNIRIIFSEQESKKSSPVFQHGCRDKSQIRWDGRFWSQQQCLQYFHFQQCYYLAPKQ